MRSCATEFDLVSAKTLETGLELMSQGWRPIAGGTDLMVLFNAGKLADRKLVSIREIPELRGIRQTGNHVVVGAGTTYSQIRASEVLRDEFPLLCEAASWVGGPANQNRGTIGGNIANASPAADIAPILLAYEAELEIASITGRRLVPYSRFHVGYKIMDLRGDELIVSIRLPREPRFADSYARKVGTRKAQAISKVCLACTVESGTGQFRIGIGSVAPTPIRCPRSEKLLTAAELSPELIAAAKQSLRSEIRPITDIRSTGEYRSRVSANLLGEFLETLL